MLVDQAATTERGAYRTHLEDHLKAVDAFSPSMDQPNSNWAPFVWPGSNEGLASKIPETGVQIGALREVGMASVQVPPDFVGFSQLSMINGSKLNELFSRKSTLDYKDMSSPGQTALNPAHRLIGVLPRRV